jgi:hypothetical protein
MKKKTQNLVLAAFLFAAGLAGSAPAAPNGGAAGTCDGQKYRVNGLITISCADFTDCQVLGGEIMVINNQPQCCQKDDLGQYECTQLNQLIDAFEVQPEFQLKRLGTATYLYDFGW